MLAHDRTFIMSVCVGVVLFVASFFANFYAGIYATERASNYVTDIILSNIPVFDVHIIFIYGAIVFWLFIITLCVLEPRRIPFVLKSLAVFIIVRSVFVSLTHIGPFPVRDIITPGYILSKFTFGGDLFFSGHTGLPFLAGLLFWKDKALRYVCLASSVIFAIVVLMGHLHYSIDVLAAFFITYSIFKISEWSFPRDEKYFDAETLPEL